MTREEAYEILKTGICLICAHGCKNMDDCDISYCGFRDAVKTVMEEPCEDAISRQAGIDIIDSWLFCDGYNETERHIMRATQSMLYDLPSVQPKILACGEGELNVPDINDGKLSEIPTSSECEDKE